MCAKNIKTRIKVCVLMVQLKGTMKSLIYFPITQVDILCLSSPLGWHGMKTMDIQTRPKRTSSFLLTWSCFPVFFLSYFWARRSSPRRLHKPPSSFPHFLAGLKLIDWCSSPPLLKGCVYPQFNFFFFCKINLQHAQRKFSTCSTWMSCVLVGPIFSCFALLYSLFPLTTIWILT